MNLTTKGRYAVMAMVELACGSDDEVMSINDISQAQEIPTSYLEQLLRNLKKSKIVVSVRGANGGYKIARDVDKISILDIIKAVEEPIKITRCKKGSGGCMGRGSKSCSTHHLWSGLEDRIESYLSSISLRDVCNGKRF